MKELNFTKEIENRNKNQSELKNTISEIKKKNTLEGYLGGSVG